MTTAEHYRKLIRQRDYMDYAEWAASIQKLDPDCQVEKTDIGPVILFSDGSRHALGR